MNGFVSLSNNMSPAIPVVIAPVNNNNNEDNSSNTNSQGGNSGFVPFSGKGVAVGGTLGMDNGEYSGVSQNSNGP